MSRPKKWDTMTPEEQEAWIEKKREQARKSYAANREKMVEQFRKYRKANSEKLREQKRKHCEANTEKLREYLRKYRANQSQADAFMQMTAAAAQLSNH